MKIENIELIVKVTITYNDNESREEAIKNAKRCVTSTSSVLPTNTAFPKTAKVFKP